MEHQTPEQIADEIVARHGGDNDLRHAIAEAIRREILHERDRCATRVEEAALEWASLPEPLEIAERAAADQLDVLARKIRGR